MSARLLLARHGATESNATGRYMGRSPEPISPEGRFQARALARRLQRVSLTAVYTSPLPRTRQTAEIVAAPHRLEVEPHPGLMEIDLERWAGMSPEEIAAAEPEAWEVWSTDPGRLELEGIEPLERVAERVGGALSELRRRHAGDTVAAVTHDGLIRIATIVALELPLSVYRSLGVDNASVTVLRLDDGRNALERLNDVAHLSGESEL